MRIAKLAQVGLLALSLSGAACVATFRPGPIVVHGYRTHPVQVVPVGIELYPRVHFRGSYAYLVDGRWYYAAPRGWVVFHEEPEELYRYRTRVYRADRGEERWRR